MVLFASGLTVFLLPFTLADTAPDGWRSGYTIAIIVVGFVFLVLFGLYEAFLAKTPFLAVNLLANRTVIGACLLEMTYKISYYCWNSYFTSFPQVVNNLTLAEAGYVNDTFDVISGVLLLGEGFDSQDRPLQVASVLCGSDLRFRSRFDDLLPPSESEYWLYCHVLDIHLDWWKYIHHLRATRNSGRLRLSTRRRCPRIALRCWKCGRRHLDKHISSSFSTVSSAICPARFGGHLRRSKHTAKLSGGQPRPARDSEGIWVCARNNAYCRDRHNLISVHMGFLDQEHTCR